MINNPTIGKIATIMGIVTDSAPTGLQPAIIVIDHNEFDGMGPGKLKTLNNAGIITCWQLLSKMDTELDIKLHRRSKDAEGLSEMTKDWMAQARFMLVKAEIEAEADHNEQLMLDGYAELGLVKVTERVHDVRDNIGYMNLTSRGEI